MTIGKKEKQRSYKKLELKKFSRIKARPSEIFTSGVTIPCFEYTSQQLQ